MVNHGEIFLRYHGFFMVLNCIARAVKISLDITMFTMFVVLVVFFLRMKKQKLKE